ncbi:MAG: YkvA family protein [Thiolinea sp.]
MSEQQYDDKSFWEKLRQYAIVAGREVVEIALKLYYCMKDPDTPKWARTVIAGSLLYFIVPVDAVPDLLPGGYVDDFGALSAALMTVAAHIKDEHVKQAGIKMGQWFGRTDNHDDHYPEE